MGSRPDRPRSAVVQGQVAKASPRPGFRWQPSSPARRGLADSEGTARDLSGSREPRASATGATRRTSPSGTASGWIAHAARTTSPERRIVEQGAGPAENEHRAPDVFGVPRARQGEAWHTRLRPTRTRTRGSCLRGRCRRRPSARRPDRPHDAPRRSAPQGVKTRTRQRDVEQASRARLLVQPAPAVQWFLVRAPGHSIQRPLPRRDRCRPDVRQESPCQALQRDRRPRRGSTRTERFSAASRPAADDLR
jgi:hypothetical protein